jgi:hypothetical protein
MEARIDVARVGEDAYKAMRGLQGYVNTEAVTRAADTHVPDDLYETARAVFSERELVDLTMTVIAINGWNRLLVAFRVPPATAPSVTRL